MPYPSPADKQKTSLFEIAVTITLLFFILGAFFLLGAVLVRSIL